MFDSPQETTKKYYPPCSFDRAKPFIGHFRANIYLQKKRKENLMNFLDPPLFDRIGFSYLKLCQPP